MNSYKLSAAFTVFLVIFSFTIHSMDKPLHDIYTAAHKGDLESLNSHIQQGKADAKALAIAASAPRINVSDETYFQAIKALIDAGVNPTEDSVRGSILHLIIERGSVPTLKYVLDHGGDKMIKMSDQDLNTPLMFALKLHKGSPIPLEITQKDLSEAEFNKELPQALKELDAKESVRFDTAKIEDMIRLLMKAGAPTYLYDKQHWLPAERINRFMLVPEADRKILLQALDRPYTPKKIRSLNMENMAKALDTLAVENPVIAGKLRMARWALESAVKEDNKDMSFKKFRVALALLAQADNDIWSKVTNNTIREQSRIRDVASQLLEERGPQRRGLLMAVLRSHPRALIELDIANEDYAKEDFEAELPQAIKELDEKEKSGQKLGHPAVVSILKSLVEKGANPNMPDSFGHPLSYYINKRYLFTDDERKELLNALGQSYEPQKPTYSMVDLPNALHVVETLTARHPQYATKLNMVHWAIYNAMMEPNEEVAVKILRIALAILAKIDSDAGSDLTAEVQDILHDAAIQLLLQKKPLPQAYPVEEEEILEAHT